MNKKVLLKTFGCQMNIRDSEFAIGILLDEGFKKANSFVDADVILFNSCSVRKHAEDRLFSNIADLAKLKKGKPGLVIGLIGCTAQNYKDKILEKAPLVDFVCGPGNEADLPKIIKDVMKNRCAIVAADKVNEKKPELFPAYRDQDFKTYVSIGEGCNNFCSYCIVPYVRGKERSRDARDIIKEIKDLAGRGFREVTLLGQNVNSYKPKAQSPKPKANFVQLLTEINKIKGIERVRFMTSHPKDASTELFKAIAGLDKVCEHLHLPLQSGSDRILRLMNRGYTKEKYLRAAKEYRKLVPTGSITTDIIVGFPSESEKDFKDTLDLMKKISFDSAFIFKYSPRPPAKAAKMKDNVPQDVKDKRLQVLLNLQCEISKLRNVPMESKIVEVLVDGEDKKRPGVFSGRTRTNKTVIFEAAASPIGRLVKIEVESITPHTLKGRLVG